MRIAIDMDDTIIDTFECLMAISKKSFEINERLFEGKSFLDGLAEINNEHLTQFIHEKLNSADFFRYLPIKKNAAEVIKQLSEKHEIFIATAAMELPNSFQAKYDWLAEHLPFISPMNYTFCGDKSIINADVLIDDSVKHFSSFSGKPLLFSSIHNKEERRYDRVNTWLDVERYFLANQ